MHFQLVGLSQFIILAHKNTLILHQQLAMSRSLIFSQEMVAVPSHAFKDFLFLSWDLNGLFRSIVCLNICHTYLLKVSHFHSLLQGDSFFQGLRRCTRTSSFWGLTSARAAIVPLCWILHPSRRQAQTFIGWEVLAMTSMSIHSGMCNVLAKHTHICFNCDLPFSSPTCRAIL